ncbi:hypothetical protein D9M72_453100 [compost metagenome]
MSLTMIGIVTSCAKDATGVMPAIIAALAKAVKARRVRLLFRMLIPGFSSQCTVFHFLEIDRRC